MTTYSGFVAATSAMSITGVVRRFTEPPRSIDTADMPCSFVRFPRGSDGPLTFTGEGGWHSAMSCELVILIEPYQQNTNSATFSTVLTLMDAIDTALRATSLSESKNTWEIRQDMIGTTDTAYWALIVTVNGRG